MRGDANKNATARVVGQLRPLAVPLVLFGFVINLSILVSPLFMMHVLDRVVPSGNLNTLILLLMIAFVALAATSVVEYFRDQILGRISDWFEKSMTAAVLSRGAFRNPAEDLRNVGKLRDFLAGRGASTALDVPWIPLFLFAVFAIHPAFFFLALVASAVFFLLSWLGNRLAEVSENAAMGHRQGGMAALGNLTSGGPEYGLMGLGENLRTAYLAALQGGGDDGDRARTIRNRFAAVGRLVRTSLQIGSLSLGAYLVTQGALSAGGMIGASIILGKTSGIIEGLIGSFGQFSDVKAAYHALSDAQIQREQQRTEVANLQGALNAVDLTVPKGAGMPPRLHHISFKLEPGECLAVMGESGSGKTTLLEALSGIAPAPMGNCFLDQTDVRGLDQNTRRTAIGFVPQSGHLFPGTVAQNISRFDPQPDDAKILAAARMAGIHGMISALRRGYDTIVGPSSHELSAGQRQRVAFARALYELPRYLFMDEPNALLDHMGERQMADAIQRLKAGGTTVIFSAHRTGIVNLADRILVLEDGRMVEFGPRAEILGRIANNHRRLRLPVSGGACQELTDWVGRQFTRGGDEEFRTRAATIATELYLFAQQNGPKENGRMLSFEFKFIDDSTCSITLFEPRESQLEAKIHKVREVVEMSLSEPGELENDEQSLATVIKLSDAFEHKTGKNKSAFLARVTHSNMNGGFPN